MYLQLILISITTLGIFMKAFWHPKRRVQHVDLITPRWTYAHLRNMVRSANIAVPAMFVDLDLFDANVQHIVTVVRESGKTLRIATKSIRCLALIKRILQRGLGVCKGVMCYSVEEAKFLAENGLDDFYIPYPTFQRSDLSTALDLTKAGKKITLTVDSVNHVNQIEEFCKEALSEEAEENADIHIRVSIDLDLSFKLFGGMVHLGAHRSTVDTIEKFQCLAKVICDSEYLQLVGVMGYEAQVAGLPDMDPYSSIPNFVIRLMKPVFFQSVYNFRQQVADFCSKNDIHLEFFNGGGSGNIREACGDSAITEVTAGSAFMQGKLFDYFVVNECHAACSFALQATRINPDYICCQSGGFVASGPNSMDKHPVPFANPWILKPYADEGFGEVQTPLQIVSRDQSGVELKLGDPIFFRPAKSGEISEHFVSYHLKRNYDIVETVPTYRGHGKVFY